MKSNNRVLAVALFLLQSVVLVAQHPNLALLKEGKTWNYEYTCPDTDNQGKTYFRKIAYTEWIEGDTIIMGKTYYKMRSNATDFHVATVSFWREENHRIYAYYEDGEEKWEELMYDFNLKAGDKKDLMGMNGLEVSQADTITVNGVNRKRIFIDQLTIWVEGIGSPYLLSEPLGHLASDGRVSKFLSCYEDGVCIFTASDFTIDNVTSNLRGMNNHPAMPSSLYDLQGRRLTDRPARGVYIEDGRLRVVK